VIRKLIGIIYAAALVAAPQNASKVYMTADRPHVMAWIGDFYHSPVYIRDALAQALVAENMPVTFIEDPALITAESLGKVQILIMFGEGRVWPSGFGKPPMQWMTEAQQKAIWEFVESGGGFLGMHNVEALYPADGLYYKLLGGSFISHPKPYSFTVRVQNKNHPVTAGVEDFEIVDEQHKVKYNLDEEHLLLRSISQDNTITESGWWNEVGKGRMVYLAPGHTRDALMHPMMQRLIRNSLTWVSKNQ